MAPEAARGSPPARRPADDVRITLGISACLLGKRVRYDGGHKRDAFLVETLGRYVRWVPVCPEVECGLPVPREAMHLVGEADAPRLVTQKTGRDLTEQMQRWARRRVRELAAEDLCGFVFKSRSPSSGMERIKVYDARGAARNVGVGLFARVFMRAFPLLPVEDDGRLHDPRLRENFIERLFALKRYRDMRRRKPTRGALVDFHADHKLLLLAHSPVLMREMGRLVARPEKFQPKALFARYEELMLKALKLLATPRKHANCLQHMMGHLKHLISADEKQELLEVIDQFRTGLVPIVVPITLLGHHVRRCGVAYLARQTYLHPHPLELKLRNHV